MIKNMRIACIFALLAPLPVVAQTSSPVGYTPVGYTPVGYTPVGEWRVADGTANMRILACDGAMWGAVSRVNHPDTDKNNPDAAKRNRPLLGLPILLNMSPSKPDQWDGHIYNAENGKTYTGNIRLKTADTLHIEGCVLGVLCGGEDWTRTQPDGNSPDVTINCQQIRQ